LPFFPPPPVYLPNFDFRISRFGFQYLMRRRFFVDHFDGRRAVLSGAAAHHAGRVLRVAPGQMFELSDGNCVWLARVEAANRDAVEFSLLEPVDARIPKITTTLLLAIVKFDRFEWALEKATELGVAEITPLAAARSEKALVAAAPKRAVRWQKILTESAQQARRLRAPLLRPTVSSAEAFRAAAPADSSAARLFFSEAPDVPLLRTVLQPLGQDLSVPPVNRAWLAIGPEGGWTENERSDALSAGFVEVSLGPNILRTETAVASALAAVNYALEPA
jgi:16S rRNA (uracil1498-N3)-methyltransferase